MAKSKPGRFSLPKDRPSGFLFYIDPQIAGIIKQDVGRIIQGVLNDYFSSFGKPPKVIPKPRGF